MSLSNLWKSVLVSSVVVVVGAAVGAATSGCTTRPDPTPEPTSASTDETKTLDADELRADGVATYAARASRTTAGLGAVDYVLYDDAHAKVGEVFATESPSHVVSYATTWRGRSWTFERPTEGSFSISDGTRSAIVAIGTSAGSETSGLAAEAKDAIGVLAHLLNDEHVAIGQLGRAAPQTELKPEFFCQTVTVTGGVRQFDCSLACSTSNGACAYNNIAVSCNVNSCENACQCTFSIFGWCYQYSCSGTTCCW